MKTIAALALLLSISAAHAQYYTSHGGLDSAPGDLMYRNAYGPPDNISQDDEDDARMAREAREDETEAKREDEQAFHIDRPSDRPFWTKTNDEKSQE